jgi:hypothetical protein
VSHGNASVIWRESQAAVGCCVIIQMQNLPSRVAKDDAHVQQTKRSRDEHKHIDGGDAVDLIAQEAPPGWRRRTMPPDHMPPDGCLADFDSQF